MVAYLSSWAAAEGETIEVYGAYEDISEALKMRFKHLSDSPVTIEADESVEQVYSDAVKAPF